jgi:hypothetical protein
VGYLVGLWLVRLPSLAKNYRCKTAAWQLGPNCSNVVTTSLLNNNNGMDSVAALLEAAEILEQQPLGSEAAAAPSSVSEDSEDEQDFDDGSDTNHAADEGKRTQPKVVRTAAHNNVEKKRRAYLASCFKDLQDCVPTVAGAKASNVCVLTSAHEHIKRLQEEERSYLEGIRWEQNRAEQLKVRFGCHPSCRNVDYSCMRAALSNVFVWSS